MSYIFVVPLANEQLGVLRADPQISLQERTVTLKNKKETELLYSKRLHVKFFSLKDWMRCICVHVSGCVSMHP